MTVSESSSEAEVYRRDDPILEVRDITVTFDMDRGQSRVIDEISIDIDRNEILGIVGESGSGKSMFASALLDAVVEPGVLNGDITYNPSSSDSIDLLNLSPEELKRYRWEEVSMVFQGAMSSFNPTLTLRGHFKETLQAHNEDVAEGMERAHRLLSDLYLNPERVLESYPFELSGGMQQRALIALSLVLEPEVLVLDEPTAALDLLMQRSILQLLEEVKEEYDLTLVFITHDLPLVAELADRLAVMYAFKFVEVGPTREILSGAVHPYTRSLLNATPNLQTAVEDMQPIEGESPDPVNVPAGCSYRSRCPLADEQCVNNDPHYHDVSEGHAAKCFYWEQAAEEIPLVLTEADRRAAGVGTDTSGPSDSAATAEEVEDTREPIVSLDDLEVHFEQESGGILDLFSEPDIVRAVDGVSLDIYDNEVVALVGESGCGKTTLGKAAIGIQRPTGGSVRYRGQDIWDAKDGKGDIRIPFEEIRNSLQIIHQDPGSSLNPNYRVQTILSEPLKRWHDDLTSDDREARILGMLETVGMSPPRDYAKRYPHQLSGGEKQRIALIRALLMNPDLILADEAISALDVSLRIEMMDLMLDLQDQFGTSFLFISHNLSNARYFTQKVNGRIGIMYLGELVEIGPPEQIIHDPRHPYTQALRWATPDLDPDAASEGELPIRKIDIPDAVDPPSGCRFHTRCPEAREVCTRESPRLVGDEEERERRSHLAACFREYEDHEYWESESIVSEEGDGPSRPADVD